jgi:hypothetical protein
MNTWIQQNYSLTFHGQTGQTCPIEMYIFSPRHENTVPQRCLNWTVFWLQQKPNLKGHMLKVNCKLLSNENITQAFWCVILQNNIILSYETVTDLSQNLQ